MKGKVVRELAPTKENNRNSEGDFITLTDGSILYAYSRYSGDGFGDGDSADIYAIKSFDNGETFGEPFLLFSRDRVKAENIMSVSFLRMENSDIGMFYLEKRDTVQCRPFFTRSADEGKTWSEPILCGDAEGYFCVLNNMVIKTESGRIIIPASYHPATSGIDNNGKKFLAALDSGSLSVFASDDDGKSFKKISEGTTIPASGGCVVGVQEPCIVELENGKLWCLIRNDSGRQYEAFSVDGGESWTQPLPSRFTSPEAPMNVKRLYSGEIIAVWNPAPKYYNGKSMSVKHVMTAGRTPFVYALSRDGGINFPQSQIIEDDEERGFAYTAIHETADNAILLAYCAGGAEDGCMLNRLRIRKIFKSEL